MTRISTVLLSAFFTLVASLPAQAEIIEKSYTYFNLTIDCDRRSALKFDYSLTADVGSAARPSSFTTDPTIPARCQQTSTASYASVRSGWDRGHLVMSNHMDINSTAIARANYMSNIMPQTSTMNQGAWLRTEEIAECYREYSKVRVMGGPVWTGGALNTYFLSSHGVSTPRSYWKVILKLDSYGNATDAIGWIVPNNTAATKSNVNSYLKSIADIEAASGYSIPVSDSFRYMVPTTSWALPSGCNLG